MTICRAELIIPGDENIRCTRRVAHLEDHGKGEVRWTDDVAVYPHRDVGRVMQEAYESLVPVPVPASERQVGGDHYRKFKIQPWDIIDEYGLTFYAGNALKYLLRNKGNRLEDLKKARHYLDKLIEIEEGKDAQA